MRSLRFFGAFLLSLVPAAAFGGADVRPVSKPGVLHLTLDAAVEMALARNFSLQVQRFAPQVAREAIRREEGAFDPTFEIGLSRAEDTVDRLFDVTGSRVGARSGSRIDQLSAGLGGLTPLGTTYGVGLSSENRATSDLDFADRFESRASLEVTQPLLRGAGTTVNLAQIRIARVNQLSSEWALRQRVIDVITELYYVYYDLHTAKENLLVAERSRGLAQQLMDNNMRRAGIGVMTPLDVTEARAQVAAREEGVILARRSILDNENLLKQLVTNDLEQMLSIRVDIVPPPYVRFVPDVIDGIRAALEQRPDYREALLEIRRRNISVAVTRNALLPRLDLSASLDLLGLDDNFATSFGRVSDRDRSGWSAGAFFSVPLGNREARGNANAARLEAARALVQLRELEQEIIVRIDNAAGQITSNRERIESTSEARKLAAESLAAGEERLRAGTGTTFEVLELQEKLSVAEFAELRARADYNKSVAEYRRQTGATLGVSNVTVE